MYAASKSPVNWNRSTGCIQAEKKQAADHSELKKVDYQAGT